MYDISREPIAGHVRILSGFAFASELFSTDRGVPLIRIRDLGRAQTEVCFSGPFQDTYIVENDDILIGMDGDFTAVKWQGGRALLNQRVCKIEPSSNQLDKGYLYYWLQPKLDEIHRRTPQTTVRHLSTKDISKIKIPFFPIQEQRCIAEILDTLDDAIQKTEQLINKLKQIKQGLLHDLLTRGIDENGQLRDPIAHPEQFKDSELGRIPKGWQVKPLREVATKIQDGTHFSPVSKEGPYRYITSRNIRFGFLDLSECGWISEVEHKSIYARCNVKKGDILLTKDGANTGNAAINPLEEEFSLLSSVALIRFDPKVYSSQYFLQYLLSPAGQRRLKDMMSGLAITRLTLEKINAFPAPVPPFDEQIRIAIALQQHDQLAIKEESTLHKLQILKKGLMHDLLTGKVRVPTP